MVQATSQTNLAIESPQGKKLFVFDRVFAPDVNQEGIWDYLSESVGAFVQGYNVSILAYGQSGAGKSFTMGTSGPGDQADLEVMGTTTQFPQCRDEIATCIRVAQFKDGNKFWLTDCRCDSSSCNVAF